jgi:DNA-binding transcriptional LysR family regulator
VEIRDLEYFLACCETRNFTAAARQVHIVQSAMSAAIARLEQEAGEAPGAAEIADYTLMTRLVRAGFGTTLMPASAANSLIPERWPSRLMTPACAGACPPRSAANGGRPRPPGEPRGTC